MNGSCGGCAGAVAVIACATALSSCGETLDPVPTQPRTVVSAEVVEARFSDSTWNYYTAQQTISSEGGYSGFPRPDAFRATTYTVERVLGPDNIWTTVMNIEQNQPLGTPPPASCTTWIWRVSRRMTPMRTFACTTARG